MNKGFSQMARQKSILLCNTQGYRKYKKELSKNQKWRLNASCSYVTGKENGKAGGKGETESGLASSNKN